jgi:hypothetical protein
MRELIVRSERELRRLNRAIAAFDHKPCRDRLRMQHLLSALLAEREAIVQSVHCAKPVWAVPLSSPVALQKGEGWGRSNCDDRL